MATDPPADLKLTPLNGEARTLDEWLKTFQLVAVVLDPYTNESSWVLETAARVLTHFREADCRVAFVVTADADDTRAFLGPWADKVFTFADPERAFAKGLGLNELPAFVHVRGDRKLVGVAEGWDPVEWSDVAKEVARANAWSAPLLPAGGDPTPFAGTAAAG